jgi:catecholate siderophore receptor
VPNDKVWRPFFITRVAHDPARLAHCSRPVSVIATATPEKEFAMARAPRHKHHSRKARSNWAVTGAFVASAAFAPRLATVVDGAELKSSLRRLRVAVPAETFHARARGAQAAADSDKPQQFEIAAGPLRQVVAELERLSGARIVIANDAINEISSPGLSGTYTVTQALARLIAGTSVTSRVSGPNTITLELRLTSEQVDVTATTPLPAPSSVKYTRPLIEIPQTIDVIPREVMEEQGVTTLSEALRNVPGISLQAGEGGGASNTSGDMFNLRGFSASNSLYVDGVRDDGLISRDVYNLEQVEVFMGPTGSDVGRGNAAGYVDMQSKVPHAQSAYAVTYAYGGGDRSRTTVDLNHAVPMGSTDSWLGHTSIRLNALWQDGGVPGRQIVEQKNQSIAPSVTFGLTTPTRVTAAVQITRQDNVPDYGIPGSAWSEPLTPTTVVAAHPVDSSNFYGSVGYDADKVEQNTYTVRAEHDANRNLTLRNQTRYNETHREAVISTVQNPASFVPETQTVAIARQGNERENEIFSNQSSVNSRFATGKLRHGVNAGLELSSEEQFAPALIGVGTRNPTSIYTPNPFDPVAGFSVARGLAFTRGKTNSAGLYAFDTIDAGAKWQLSGGLRLEHYNATFKSVDAVGVTTADLDTSDLLVSGKAGVLYKLTDQANLYASYGSTVTPPGTANFTLSTQPNNQNNPNVDPQESTNYEVGGKAAFYGGRLSLAVAGFRTENKNVIFTVDATAIPPIYNQDDGQRVNGITIGSLGRITDRWELNANFGYLDSWQVSQNPLNNGKQLTLTPKVSGSLWTTYDLPRGLTLGGGVRYMDEVFVNAPNTIRVPSYALTDVMVEYEVNTHLSLRLNLNNVTDATYIRNVNNNGGRYNPGTPRAATLTSSVRF